MRTEMTEREVFVAAMNEAGKNMSRLCGMKTNKNEHCLGSVIGDFIVEGITEVKPLCRVHWRYLRQRGNKVERAEDGNKKNKRRDMAGDPR